MNRSCSLAFVAFLFAVPGFAQAPLPAPANLSFEESAVGAVPAGWEVSPGDEGTVADTRAEDCPDAGRCARLVRKEEGRGYSALLEYVRADAYRGKRIRLRGMLRKVKGAGDTLLYLQVNSPSSPPRTVTGPGAGTTWRRDELLLDIPKDAATFQFGVVVTGPAEAWIDAVEVQTLGESGMGDEPPRALTDQGAANLAALCRLIGLVRYFHPSDESARLDWPAWTIEAVGPVEGARDAADLARVFARLLKPIAPTAQVFLTGEPPPPLPPPASPESRTIAWRHYGLDTGTPRSQRSFASRRVGGFEGPEGFGQALWILDATALQGTTLRLGASTRLEPQSGAPAAGELWISVVDHAGRLLAEARKPVEGADWRDDEIAIAVLPGAARAHLGARLTGDGRLFLDRVQVAAIGTGGPDAARREVLADGFEKGAPGEHPDGWLVNPRTRAAGYRVEITQERPHEGARALMIAWGPDAELPDPAQPLVAELSAGVSLRLPLALSTDSRGTLPQEPLPPGLENGKPEGFIPSGEDRATRLADVLLLGAAFDHFYPYPLSDWPASLDRAFRAAAVDKDTRSFLDTLRRLTSVLNDNHATVSHAVDPSDHRLPLFWRVIEDRLVVTGAPSSLDAVRPGDVVEEVDGIPAREAILQLESLTSAATPAYRRHRALELLAAGRQGARRTLRLRRGGETLTATLEVDAALLGPNRLREPRPEKVAELHPGLFYLDLDRIDDQDFTTALPRLQEAKGIVFDLRGYPERISERFLAHLIPAPARTPGTWTAIRSRPDGEPRLDHLAWKIQPLSPRIKAPVVFLADERSYSRAESFLDIVSFYGLGKIVGATTGGTNGEVNDMVLPGGYSVTWTGSRVQRLSGKELQGVGIPATIPVAPSLAGIEAGRDEVLEQAITILRNIESDGTP